MLDTTVTTVTFCLLCTFVQSQYTLIMDILTNLLLRKEPKRKVRFGLLLAFEFLISFMYSIVFCFNSLSFFYCTTGGPGAPCSYAVHSAAQ